MYPAVLNFTTYSTMNLHGQKVLSYVIGSFTLAMEPQDSNICQPVGTFGVVTYNAHGLNNGKRDRKSTRLNSSH